MARKGGYERGLRRIEKNGERKTDQHECHEVNVQCA